MGLDYGTEYKERPRAQRWHEWAVFFRTELLSILTRDNTSVDLAEKR